MEQKKKTNKYYDSKEVAAEVKNILDNYPEQFSHLPFHDITFLFKVGKNNPDKKHVDVKIVKEPYTSITTKKVILSVTDEFWKDELGPVRTKALLEGLISVTLDVKSGNLKKRRFDIQTFSDLIKGGKLDFSKFAKVLPTEREDLVLSAK